MTKTPFKKNVQRRLGIQGIEPPLGSKIADSPIGDKFVAAAEITRNGSDGEENFSSEEFGASLHIREEEFAEPIFSGARLRAKATRLDDAVNFPE